MPCALLMPLISRYRRSNPRKDVINPFTTLKCLMAAMCFLMLEWELYDAKWVAKSMSVRSETGKAITLCRLQKYLYVRVADV